MPTTFVPSDALRPRLTEGRHVADAGDLSRAATLFRRLLKPGTEGGPYDRIFVLSSLMTVYSRLGSQYETLVLARYLTDRLLQMGQLEATAGCMATYCEAINGVANRELRIRRLEELDGMLTQLEPDQGGMPREAYHSCAFDLALEIGDVDRARMHAERYRAFQPDYEGRPWRKALQTAIYDIRLDLAAGMPHRALDILGRIDPATQRLPEPEAVLAWFHVQCLDAAGDVDGAEAAALRYLELLERTWDDEALAPHRVRDAARLAAWFAARPGHETAARRTYDLAAAGVLQRITQLNVSVKELQRIGVDVGGAADDLAELRRTFVADQGDLLMRVAALFRRQPQACAGFLVSEEDDQELVHLCAWCERVRTEEGVWLPIGHFIPRTGPLPISHGICSDCLEREQIR